MYGLMLKAAAAYLQKNYPDVYEDVLEQLGFSEERDLDKNQIYSDKLFSRITKLMSDKAGCGEDELLESFGEYFIDYVVRMGYNDLLFSLGRTISDMVNELDNLHEYVRFTYPKLKAPSFICLHESVDGITLLYRSRRRGFQSYVKGVLRSIALRYYNMQISVEIAASKDVGEIREVTYNLVFDNTGSYATSGDVILRDTYFKSKVIMADTVFELYPFHILVNEQMEIMSVGKGLKQLFPKVLRDDFTAHFEVSRPDIEPTFRSIQNHLNNIFELSCILKHLSSAVDTVSLVSTDGLAAPQQAAKNEYNELTLKGQMVFIDDWNCIMFIGFPLLMMPEQMLSIGLYLSDLSLFDSSRDLVMAAAQDAADRQLTHKLLSVKANVVAEASNMAEKAKEDWQRTHYALLPPTISQRLMRSEPAYALSSVVERGTVITVEIVDERLHTTDKAMFSLIEEVHKDAQQICAKYGMFKVDGRLSDFIMLAGIPDPLDHMEVMAFRAAKAITANHTVRVGMATGQVAAGVVGCKLLAYTPFGDAVKMSKKLMLSSVVKGILAGEQSAQGCTDDDSDITSEQGPDLQDSQITIKTFWLRSRKPGKESKKKL